MLGVEFSPVTTASSAAAVSALLNNQTATLKHAASRPPHTSSLSTAPPQGRTVGARLWGLVGVRSRSCKTGGVKESRKPAVIRGFASSTLAIFIALAGHVSGGGQMPGPLGIVIPWILASMVCVILAGKRLSVLRMSASVGISQFLFHALFVLGTVTPSGGPAPEHVHGAPLVLPAGPGTADAVIADGPMWLSHLAAAMVTIAVLRWGEHLVHAAGRLAAQAVRWVRRRFSPPVLVNPVRPSRRLGGVFFVARRAASAHLATLRGRAPPASPAI